MNTKGASIDVYQNGEATCNVSLPEKMAYEDGFLKNVAKTINRTWVHSAWNSVAGARDSNDCEHISDKFWLLGGGHVENGGDDELNAKDKKYDTAKFANIYFDNASRIKYFMTSAGEVSNTKSVWILRSSYLNDSTVAGIVSSNGSISFSVVNYRRAISPVCQIG